MDEKIFWHLILAICYSGIKKIFSLLQLCVNVIMSNRPLPFAVISVIYHLFVAILMLTS